MLNVLKGLPTYFVKERNNFYLVVVSISQGWGVLKITNKSVLFGNSFLESFVLSDALVFNAFFGFYKNYCYFLKLKGMGFKILGHNKGVFFKLGYSHKLLVLKTRDVCFFYLTRRLFQIKGRDGFFLKKLISRLIKLRKSTVYKKKGILLKGSIQPLKLTSKKSKF